MGAGGLDALRPGLDDLRRQGLGVTALDLGHARPHAVTWKPSADEDDKAVEPRDSVPAVRERIDRQLELFTSRDRSGHNVERSPTTSRAPAADEPADSRVDARASPGIHHRPTRCPSRTGP